MVSYLKKSPLTFIGLCRALVLCSLGASSLASAQGALAIEDAAELPKLWLEVDACVALPRALIEAQLLGELGATLAPSRDEAVVQLWVGCEQEAWALEVRHAITTRQLKRRLPKEGAQATDRARVLVLALGELVEQSALVLERPSPEPLVLRWEPVMLGELPQQPPMPWQLGAMAWMQRGHLSDAALDAWGAQLMLRRRVGLYQLIWAQLAIARAEQRVAQGQLNALLYSGALGWSPLWVSPRSWLGLTLGAGARFGGARFEAQGQPQVEATAAQLPFAGPILQAQALFIPTRAVEVVLQAELGWAALAAQANADGRAALAISALWSGYGVGVAWRFF